MKPRDRIEKEILAVLASGAWVRSFDIREILQAMRIERATGFRRWLYARYPITVDLFAGPSFGSLYVALYRLEESRVVVSRWKDESPEMLAERGGYRAREYSLARRCDKPRPPDAIVKARWCPEPEEDAKFHRRVSENIISGNLISGGPRS